MSLDFFVNVCGIRKMLDSNPMPFILKVGVGEVLEFGAVWKSTFAFAIFIMMPK